MSFPSEPSQRSDRDVLREALVESVSSIMDRLITNQRGRAFSIDDVGTHGSSRVHARDDSVAPHGDVRGDGTDVSFSSFNAGGDIPVVDDVYVPHDCRLEQMPTKVS